MPQALEQKLSVSLSPHVQSRDSVSSVMWAVNFALLPAMAVSVWSFGIRVLAIIAVSVITSLSPSGR
jgi:electron transport complex protein RnfD